MGSLGVAVIGTGFMDSLVPCIRPMVRSRLRRGTNWDSTSLRRLNASISWIALRVGMSPI
jgi:hypothetical protein